ncbi:MAG: hypothetical protein HYU66_10595 [Armatimonadetes bacterium]|nr:hypothetical protein [Armatimonadota bacterium]
MSHAGVVGRACAAVMLCCGLAACAAPARLAVGGGLRIGYGGVLLRAGLPFDYLTAEEQCDPAVLGRFDCVLIAGLLDECEHWAPKARRAFDAYVRGGGHLLCEVGAQPEPLLDSVRGPIASNVYPPVHEGQAFRLVTGDHPLLKRFSAGQQWDYDHYLCIVPADEPQVTVLARYTRPPAAGRPALLSTQVGGGEVIYSAGVLSYMQGNWSPWYEDPILAIVEHLTGGRAVRLWANEPAEPEPATGPPTAAAKPYPRIAGADDLGAAEPGGYCLRCAWPAGKATLHLEPTSARGGGLTVRIDSRVVQVAGGARPLRVDVPADVAELALRRTPERLDVLSSGGAVAGSAAAPLHAELGVFAEGLADPLLQPVEPAVFGDDFSRSGELGPPWEAAGGTWQLTAPTTRMGVQAPALLGKGGWVTAGQWFWSDVRLRVAVRPRADGEIRLQTARWDAGNALELRLPVGAGRARLVRLRGGKETVLAEGGAGLRAQQWQLVELCSLRSQVAARVDGAEILRARCDDLGPGGIALGATGTALFDDVAVAPADLPPPLPAVHPVWFDKGPAGLLDRDTWSAPAAAWLPEEQTGRMWHLGRFGGDFRLVVRAVRKTGDELQLTLHAGPERASSPVLTVAGPHVVELCRAAGTLSATVDGRAAKLDAAPTGTLCLGLEWSGLALAPEDIHLTAAGVDEATFERAPVDWWEAAGEWTIASRWSCDPKWSWLVGAGRPRAILWHKRRVQGDVVAQTFLGVQQQHEYGVGAELFERLRITLAGDGEDPWSGYVAELGGDGPGHARLYRSHRVVAASEVPLPYWRELHNSWCELRAERHGAKVTVWFHRRRVLDFDDPAPLPDGQVALWAEQNRLVTPYLAVYGGAAPSP